MEERLSDADKEPLTVAAGSVCWRRQARGVEILVVNRPFHNDTSFPKGKRDDLETLPQTAKREVLEETGFEIDLGPYLGEVSYTLEDGSPKTVHYWGSEIDSSPIINSEFKPNDEVSSIEWVNIDEVPTRLTYDLDRDMVERFREALSEGKVQTFPMIFLRHAEAEHRVQANQDDRDRPLTKRGLEDAKNISAGIMAFSPIHFFSSPSRRCRDTASIISEFTDTKLEITEAISQELSINGSDGASELLKRQIKRKAPSLFCSHAPVLLQLLETAAQCAGVADDALIRVMNLSEGSFSVIHLASNRNLLHVTSVESHSPPNN